MIKYLIDTNILSEPLRRQPHLGVVEKLTRFQGQLAISATVWHEVIFGCQMLPPSKKRRTFEAYFFEAVAPAIPVLPYDAQAARWHAEERARLRHRTPPFRDGQIAAVAKVHNLILVTANVVDFQCFAGLSIENWMSVP